MLFEYVDAVRQAAPLIHCITNPITANDCANILLACGASPIMAEHPAEAAEITTLCAGLSLNMGMPQQETLSSMLLAGRQANALSRPVVLDPVGIGASSLRREMGAALLSEVQFTAIKANVSELKALTEGSACAGGVDASESDAATPRSLPAIHALAKSLACDTRSTVIVTGAIDVITDGKRSFFCYNGHPMQTKITGCGCMLAVLIAAFLAASPDKAWEAAAAAVCAMGVCGELAHQQREEAHAGSASYRTFLIDQFYLLEKKTLEEAARFEIQ